MAHQRAELLDRNKKLFTSIDMLVQVRLKEVEVEVEVAKGFLTLFF
jgi:hypothetical protein